MTIHTFFNGHRATTADLAPLVFSGFAHFTAMQVRDRAVRGLDIHLARLRRASDELFGRHLPDDQVRSLLSSAAGSAPPDCSLTCYMTSRPGEFMGEAADLEIDVLIKVTAPVAPPSRPLALDVVQHERHLPHLKHVGEVAKTQYLRRAGVRGFDDAAFTDSSGRLSEATIWNLAFWDAGTVCWPEADVLPGVTMQILQRQLPGLGVAQTTRGLRLADLSDGLAAVVMNSWSPGVPVTRMARTPLADARELVQLVHQAYATEPLVPL